MATFSKEEEIKPSPHRLGVKVMDATQSKYS